MYLTTKMESDIFGILWYLEMKTHLKGQKPKAWLHLSLPSLDQEIFTRNTVLQSQFFPDMAVLKSPALPSYQLRKANSSSVHLNITEDLPWTALNLCIYCE